jgi:tetratricopeptide (TPR) repeat protein
MLLGPASYADLLSCGALRAIAILHGWVDEQMTPSATTGPPSSTANVHGPWQELRAAWQRLFGYDFFVSYAWLDGRAYAEVLVEQLTARYRYRCFLDDREMGGGDAWRASVRRALGRSSVLVLVATPAALERDNVFLEIQAFSKRGHPIVPIDLANSVERLPRDHRLYPLLEERIRVAEPFGPDGKMAALPSEIVMKFLNSSFRFTRVGRIRTLILGVAIAFFAALAAMLAFLFVLERTAKDQAQKNEQKAERAFVASGTTSIELLQTIVNNYSQWAPADSAISEAVIAKVQELVTKFVNTDATTGFVHLKGLALLALSSLMTKKGDLEQAKKYAEQAVLWTSGASDILPDAGNLFLLHVSSLSELAEINLKMNDTPQFLANYTTAINLLREAIASHRFVNAAKNELSGTYRRFTLSLMQANRIEDAENVLNDWVKLLDGKVAAEGESSDDLNDLADANLRLFAIVSRLEHTDSNDQRMLSYGRLALMYLKRLAQKGELKPDKQRYLTQLQSLFEKAVPEMGK